MIKILDWSADAATAGGAWMADDETPLPYHEPVLLRKTIEFLAPGPGKLFVDGTVGGGGHSRALLDAGASVVGLDQDLEAIRFSQELFRGEGERFIPVHSNFSEVSAVLAQLGIEKIDGALLDLGVSSWQLDTPERGFSFMREGPLDMRMDPTTGVTAAEIVNKASVEQLERIFWNYGEEHAARRIAARITRDRLVKPFATTSELASSVEAVVPRHGRTHPATRVFQALRIAVNRELEALQEGLEQFTKLLRPGGRFGVITFHSLEDRMVKTFFRHRSAETLDRPEWPAPRPNPDFTFRRITSKAVVPNEAEQTRNPRSRSAKLRVVEKL